MPVGPDRYQIKLTVGASTYEKLRLAQDLLRHAVPTGDTAQIVDRALTVLLDHLARAKFAATDRPRPGQAAVSASRHVPAAVKRAVWLRDAGRCAFVAAGGRRCADRGFLEFHHVRPYAAGGEATVDNIQLRCRSHNGYEADLFYQASRGRDGEGTVNELPARYAARGATARPGTAALPGP